MLEGRDLQEALDAVHLTPLQGPFHRYVLHRYIVLALQQGGPLHILSGEWSLKTGGRFNYPGRNRTTYLATTARTAQVEAERVQAPYVHLPIKGKLQHVLDVTNPGVTALLHILPGELTENWRMLNARGQEAPTQRLGHAAYTSTRVEAIAYPSTMHSGGVCLAVFPERLVSGSLQEIDDPHEILRERIP